MAERLSRGCPEPRPLLSQGLSFSSAQLSAPYIDLDLSQISSGRYVTLSAAPVRCGFARCIGAAAETDTCPYNVSAKWAFCQV